MSEICTLSVFGIKIQKDNYRSSLGASMGETEFWNSSENIADLVGFKRAIAKCKLEGFGFNEEFECIVSLRAGFVRIRLLNPRVDLNAGLIATILQALVGMLYHIPGHRSNGVLEPISSNDISRYMFCSTYNSHWLVGALHEIMDEKNLRFELDGGELNAMKAGLLKYGYTSWHQD